MSKIKTTTCTISAKILARIRHKGRGWVFTPKDFLDLAARPAIGNILSRFTKRDLIRNIGKGIYDYPKQHQLLGALAPNKDNIAKAIATKDAQIVYPSGAMAANMLGLSTQVPVNSGYLSNGPSRHKQIGRTQIIIKHARVPLLDKAPFTVNLTIQALSYLGNNAINDQIINKCANNLTKQDKLSLNKAATKLPAWMAKVIHKIKIS